MEVLDPVIALREQIASVKMARGALHKGDPLIQVLMDQEEELKAKLCNSKTMKVKLDSSKGVAGHDESRQSKTKAIAREAVAECHKLRVITESHKKELAGAEASIKKKNVKESEVMVDLKDTEGVASSLMTFAGHLKAGTPCNPEAVASAALAPEEVSMDAAPPPGPGGKPIVGVPTSEEVEERGAARMVDGGKPLNPKPDEKESKRKRKREAEKAEWKKIARRKTGKEFIETPQMGAPGSTLPAGAGGA